MAAPLVWQDFLSEDDITWSILRGRIGYRKGDLVVKGDGSTPVIVSPDAQPIDWLLYEAVEIRMLAEGGQEIKIRIGNEEFKQPIPALGEYHNYRFDVNAGGARGSRPLAIMPTDSLTDAVAIASIKLVPRKANFPGRPVSFITATMTSIATSSSRTHRRRWASTWQFRVHRTCISAWA